MRWLAASARFALVALFLVSALITLQKAIYLTVFLRNLHRKHALNFRISLACFRWSGFKGPFRFPTRFSVSGFPVCDCLRTFVSDVFAAIGLFRDGFLVGGEVDDA